MASVTGTDYGLTPAPGHGHGLKLAEQPSSSMTDLDPEEFKRLQLAARRRQSASSLPWENQAA